MATVETCTGNPAVMGFFMTNFVYPQITLYATDYGGPGILLGTAWPFVFAAFAIAVWRVYTRPSLRAALLLAATSVNVADCANVTWARSIDPLKLRLMVKQYLYLAIIFAQIKVAILIWAAGIRFSQIFLGYRTKAILSQGYAIFACAISLMLIGIGCSNVHRNGQVGMIYWGLAVIDPASYVAVGIFTFSWRLRQLRSEVRQYSNTAQPDQLKHLTSANDILMGLTLVTAICAIGVTQSLDSLQNKYVLPAILVLTSIWTFAESAFEILTMLQQANEAANSANSAEREFKNKVPGIEKQKIAFGAEKP